MLFIDKPITVQRIREFCANYDEGVRVEYKSTFDENVRRKIPKVVSSFANAQGGVLVIGINTLNGVPQPPFDGLEAPAREELKLTVENICLRSIYPPLLPNITVVPSDVAGRQFLVIEVEESAQAPHAIENSTMVYIRTGNAANPFDLADLDLILDLIKRRTAPLELRNRLLVQAQGRSADPGNLALPRMEVTVCPAYPRTELCNSPEVWTFLQQMQPRGMTFLLPLNSLRRVPDGAASLSPHGQTRTRQYFEHSKFGLLFASRPFGRLPWTRPEDPLRQLAFGDLLHILLKITMYALRFFRDTYRGDVNITVSLASVQNQIMRFRNPDIHFLDNDHADDFTCHADTVTAIRTFSTELLEENRAELVTSLLTEITWAFWQGFYEHPAAAIENLVRQNLA